MKINRWVFFFASVLWLFPSFSFAAQGQGLPLTIGAGGDPCVAAGSCNMVDLVQALMITQDVLVYGVACFLFFFGFQSGMGFMLGAISRQGSSSQ